MKSIGILVIALCAVHCALSLRVVPKKLSQHYDNTFNNWRSQCKVRSGATEEAIERARNGDLENAPHELMVYSFCTYEIAGSLYKDGKLIMDQVNKYLGPENQQDSEIYRSCSEEAFKSGEDDKYKRHFAMIRCLYKNLKTENFVFD